MDKPIATEKLNGLCSTFLQLKHSIGLKYISEERAIHQFIRFCENKYAGDIVPRDCVCAWIASNPNQKSKTKQNKAGLMRELAKYLTSHGYINLNMPRINESTCSSFIPHIYTAHEMEAIWNTIDHIPPLSRVPNSHRCYQVLFRLLYSSGLRISEALGLTKKDIDLVNRVITVRYAKFGRERLIPLSGSLFGIIKAYYDECLSSSDEDSPVFYSRRGMILKPHSVYTRFRTILKESGIPYRGREKGPRLHDLRHTFAVRSMNRLAGDGKDIYVSLPILSVYLGHANVLSTERYIRLTEDRFEKISETLEQNMPNIFPEVEPINEI